MDGAGGIRLLGESEEAAPALGGAADLPHCRDGSVGPIDPPPQPGLKRSRFLFSDAEQDVLWRARCRRVSVCRCERGSQVSRVNLKPTCKPTPGHQHTGTNVRVNTYACVHSCRGQGECAVWCVRDCDTSARTHTQEEVKRLGCTFLVVSLVARKGDRPSAGLTCRGSQVGSTRPGGSRGALTSPVVERNRFCF